MSLAVYSNSMKQNLKFGAGILISLVFMYLAFRKADLGQTVHSLKTANYLYLIPAVAALFLSHYLRALRWRYLLDPIRRLDMKSLFSSLIIGYMANAFTPAHLGEFLRAYVLSKKRQISMGSTFATIVVERIIDVFSLLAVMLLVIFIHPFPEWVIKSGYVMLIGSIGLLLALIILRKMDSKRQLFLGLILRPLPGRFTVKIEDWVEKFFEGVIPLRRGHDYITVFVLSVAIWVCYGLVFYLCLQAFDFIITYDLAWYVSLVLLAITSISVVVPSSPGYVGTYHYLCQVSLGMFGVPSGPALSYAAVAHGIMLFPVIIIGLVLANCEGMKVSGKGKGEQFAKGAPEVV